MDFAYRDRLTKEKVLKLISGGIYLLQNILKKYSNLFQDSDSVKKIIRNQINNDKNLMLVLSNHFPKSVYEDLINIFTLRKMILDGDFKIDSSRDLYSFDKIIDLKENLFKELFNLLPKTVSYIKTNLYVKENSFFEEEITKLEDFLLLKKLYKDSEIAKDYKEFNKYLNSLIFDSFIDIFSALFEFEIMDGKASDIVSYDYKAIKIADGGFQIDLYRKRRKYVVVIDRHGYISVTDYLNKNHEGYTISLIRINPDKPFIPLQKLNDIIHSIDFNLLVKNSETFVDFKSKLEKEYKNIIKKKINNYDIIENKKLFESSLRRFLYFDMYIYYYQAYRVSLYYEYGHPNCDEIGMVPKEEFYEYLDLISDFLDYSDHDQNEKCIKLLLNIKKYIYNGQEGNISKQKNENIERNINKDFLSRSINSGAKGINNISKFLSFIYIFVESDPNNRQYINYDKLKLFYDLVHKNQSFVNALN